jgi:superfamily II DNA or RNA helicase
MPLSFKGRLIQYAGRLHRAHADKRETRIYDYVDDLPLTRAMFRRRQAAYHEMGYVIRMNEREPDAPPRLCKTRSTLSFFSGTQAQGERRAVAASPPR